MTTPNSNEPAPAPSDFIRDVVAEDVKSGKLAQIHTRFPPEPNGYLHIGHAKSICLNFGIAREFGGICNIRMDDTNPAKEEAEYVESIIADTKWLIDGWADDTLGLKARGKTPDSKTNGGRTDFELSAIRNPQSETPVEPFHASDYFDQLYEYAVRLVREGKAYVYDMTPEETDEFRRLGKESPFRNRSVEENLDLFARMKAGEFPDGARTLRAKIDMSVAEHLAARPGSLSYPPRGTSSHRQELVHLSDVRLRSYPERLHRRDHALASARSSSRCIGRFTTGSWPRSISPDRSRISTNSRGSTLPTPS